MDLASLFEPAAVTAFFEILMIDIVLAGDNAIVIALASRSPDSIRRRTGGCNRKLT